MGKRGGEREGERGNEWRNERREGKGREKEEMSRWEKERRRKVEERLAVRVCMYVHAYIMNVLAVIKCSRMADHSGREREMHDANISK